MSVLSQERIWLHTPIVVDQYALTPETLSGQGMFASLLVYAAALWRVVAWVTHPPRLPMTRGAMARSDGGFA